MYTRCPECHTPYRVNSRLLRAGAEDVLCGRCQLVFNAGTSLEVSVPEAESADGVQAAAHLPLAGQQEAAATPIVPRWRLGGLEESEPSGGEDRAGGIFAEARQRLVRPRSRSMLGDDWLWGVGVVVLTALLVVQAFLFESKHLAQNALLRPWLDSLCGSLGCVLPPFRDTPSIKILDRGLSMAGGRKDAFEFNLTFANQSE
ncbi:DUF3426 domain-containing protein, partial [Methylomagnum sp.]